MASQLGHTCGSLPGLAEQRACKRAGLDHMRLQPLVAHRTDSTRLCAARRAANARTPRSKTVNGKPGRRGAASSSKQEPCQPPGNLTGASSTDSKQPGQEPSNGNASSPVNGDLAAASKADGELSRRGSAGGKLGYSVGSRVSFADASSSDNKQTASAGAVGKRPHAEQPSASVAPAHLAAAAAEADLATSAAAEAGKAESPAGMQQKAGIASSLASFAQAGVDAGMQITRGIIGGKQQQQQEALLEPSLATTGSGSAAEASNEPAGRRTVMAGTQQQRAQPGSATSRLSVAQADAPDSKPSVPAEPAEPAVEGNGGGSTSSIDDNGGPKLTKSASTAGRGRSSTPEARKATIAKISAAKALARKLAEEKQAAMVAARLLSDSSVDEEEVDAIKQSVERASTEAAREAARADAMARAAKKSGLQGAELLEFQRLKAENDALRQLVLDVAANREEAEARMARLQQSYNRLVEQASLGSQMSMDEEVAPASSDEAAAAARQEDIVKVVMGLALAKKTLEREQPSAPEEPKTPPPPVPQPKPQPSLPALVDAANKAGTAIFTVPEAGAPVPGTVTLYYNRNAGPLPFGAQCQFKMGINKWEDIVLRDMEAVALQDGDWWQIEITLDADVFRVNYVINDKSSGIVDNNRGQDFSLALVDAPTEEEVFARRAAAVQALEEQLRQDVEREEARLWEESRARAVQQADEARQRYRADREAELRMEAGELVAERRSGLDALPTSDGREGVFGWLRGRPQAGQEATLVYNKNAGALRNSADVQVNLGYDHWWQQDIKEIRLSRMPIAEVERNGLPRHNCDWWECTVQIPSSAAILDYVFCDTAKRAWDNNGMADYHTAIADALSDAELERHFCNTVLHISEQELQEGMERAAKRAVRRAEIKATAQRKRRDKQRQVLYTNPVFPKAGEHADVFYNPDATVLRGRPETWVRGSWNRWTHPQCFMPQRMLPVIPGGTGFHKASLQVPSDAHVMDLVFSDVGDMHGGFYDSNNGLDYHIPVVGSPGKLPSLHVVHVAVEMAPIAKVGGMGDVVTALARAVQDEGHRVEVILPKFDCINYAEVRNLRLRGDFFWSNSQVKVWEAVVENVQTILLEPTNGFFWVGCIYGRNDDAQRFGYFCGAALEYLKHHSGGTRPDIIHCHDWQTAPVAFGDCHPSRPVFTIHNLNYGADLIGRAMAAAAVATTVSPTYAAEVSGHPAVAPHMAKFYGIINGIDQDIWDPEEDRFLPKNFGVEDVAEGKAAAKAALRQRMDLSAAEVPLVAVVTRLTHQKGIHLIKHAAWRTLERGAQFVLLGSAPDPRVQAEFNQLADTLRRQYPDRARLWFAYDEPLSHLIYAGADMLLVPSMFEPCGLTQMIGMRYGTIPVVRRTGGLNDTVFDLDDDEERAQQHGMERNGFSFDGTDAGGMDYALNRALSSWFEGHESGEWTRLQQRVMQQDWSWTAPAEDYIELYYKALKPQG